MLRKFPFNSPAFAQGAPGFPPGHFNPPPQQPQQNIDVSQMDDVTKKEFFGDRLYSKVSMNPNFSKFTE